MSQPRQKRATTPSGRRYLVHLSCVPDGDRETGRYIARINPWATRNSSRTDIRGRVFVDECELIETINPLLPHGSDIRDVFEHIESPSGFFYLLRLNSEEAAQLGWRPELTSGDRE
jgi:hypothetical protein